MRKIGEPDQDGPDERADHLSNDITRNLDPGEAANRGQRDRHRRIQMCSADASNGVDGHRDRDAPAGRDHDPPGAFTF